AADAARAGAPHVRPRRAGVGRLVDAVAGNVAVADRPRLAGAGPYDFRIRWRPRQRADPPHPLGVEHRLERFRAVGGLPDAARGGARVVDLRVAGYADD